MSTSKILITGITGQDGIFLSSNLIEKYGDVEIIGTTRSKATSQFFNNYKQISNEDKLKRINLIEIDLTNREYVNKLIQENKFDKIINLAGPSSVYESFSDSKKFKNTIIEQFDNLINSCISNNTYPSFFQASSSEMFSSKADLPLKENSLMEPRSPYAIAKYDLHKRIEKLKTEMNWNIKSGIMFNHESEFRNNNFLIMKIITTALSIQRGKAKKLVVGSIDYKRDWTHAYDIVDAISKIIYEEKPIDYVIGSGRSNSVLELIKIVFSFLSLKYEDFLIIDDSLLREGDPNEIVANPSLINKNLGWSPKINFENMVVRILNYKINNS